MITIVDYGVENLNSLVNMFNRIGSFAKIESDPEKIAAAVGSMFVFQKKGNAVLVNFHEELRKFNSHLLNCF